MRNYCEFRCKKCGSLVEFDSFGNYRCKKCKYVGKDRSLIIVRKENKKNET